ncbi:hypothetical protein NHP190003_16070 (plasmid) [Helicobacter sp. NHP19-003]|uniref:Outer membrane protein n=2 Tax=Helicobacter gastrocanis TaxID=2849641 RepID=A0ABN6I9S8_9HELI|nr:hypothetical protein NHP190003_16070 [Helicobacter sp. NHP19-003]
MGMGVLQRDLLSLCLVLTPLYGYDVRNGAYLSGTVGAQNMDTTTNTPSGSSTMPLNSTNLQSSLSTHLQELIDKLQSLNTDAAQVGTTLNITKIDPIEAQATQAQIQTLEAQVATQIAQLEGLIDTNQQASANATDQSILQAYSAILQDLKNVDASLEQEINQYNHKLMADKNAFANQTNRVIEENKQAQATYAQDKNTYANQTAVYNATTQDLSNNLSACIDSPRCEGLPNSYTSGQVQVALTQMMRNAYNIVYSNMPWFFSGPYKTQTSKVITQNEWEQAVQDGKKRASFCRDVSCMNNFYHKFEKVLGPLSGSGVSAEQITRVYAWFYQTGAEIFRLGGPITPIRSLIMVYNYYVALASMVPNYAFFPPSTTSVFGPPPTLHQQALPTPPTLGLTYKDLASAIQAAQNKLDQQGHVTSMQGTINLSPLSRTINSLSRPFANINWNANLGVGFQYFFANRIGMDVHANLGYSYLNSPLLRELSDFKSLQGFLWEAGVDVILDLFISRGPKKWFSGLYAGAMGTGNYFFLDALASHGVTSNYNVLFNAGLRLQIEHNIFKVGIMDPLIARYIDIKMGNSIIILDENYKDIDVYISFAHLF